MKLSILICSLEDRLVQLQQLRTKLIDQSDMDVVEILTETDAGEMHTGAKRNKLLLQAKGDYIAFVDDDDMVSDDYVSKILKAIETNPDCCGLEGIITTDGNNPHLFIHSLTCGSWYEKDGIYYRTPNHLNTVKREIALKVMFNDDMSNCEDRDYSLRIQPYLKTEEYIKGPIYFYKCTSAPKQYNKQRVNKSKVILVNYADKHFYHSQKHNTETGKQFGFNGAAECNLNSLDINFRNKFAHILNQSRGAGYWLWKPYIICKVLEQVNYGDIVFYCDSGAIFEKDITPLIDICREDDIVLFHIAPHGVTEPHTNAKWTKRDAFVLMGCDEEKYYNANQYLGGFQIYKKTDRTMVFVKEMLKYSQDERIITDLPNTCNLPNLPQFREHRHDTSVLSLMATKYGIKGHRDPSQFGDDFHHMYPDDKYDRIILSTRDRR